MRRTTGSEVGGGLASPPRRGRWPCHAAICAVMLSASPGQATESCYREDELRADVEAKLADFIEPLVISCSEATQISLGGLWEEFLDQPDIASRLAEADALREPYYQRLHGDEHWKLRWQRIEFAVITYATELIRNEPPQAAGCARLRQQLLSFHREGWPAYESMADRLLELVRPQVRLCTG